MKKISLTRTHQVRKFNIMAACALATAVVLGAASTALAAPADFKTAAVSGGVEITEYVGPLGDDVDVSVPSSIDGKSVVAIGKNAFEDVQVRSVTLPSTVTAIKDGGFLNCHATSIDLSSSKVKSIGADAFNSVQYLEGSFKLPSTLTKIGKNAFDGASFSSITIPAKVKTIPEFAFFGCTNLKTVTFKSGLETIENNAFKDCEKLKKISLPKTVKKVGGDAFNNDPIKTFKVNKKSKKFAGKGNILYNKKMTKIYIFGNGYKKTSWTAPKKVTSIGTSAFSYTDLKKIKLTKNVKTIGKNAFADCQKLKSAKLTGKLKTIKDHAFDGCYSLKSVTFGKKVKTIGKSAFYDCQALKTVTIPKNVKKIGKMAFGYELYIGGTLNEEGETEEYSEDVTYSLTIKGAKKSAAYKYAKANKLKFKKA